MQGGQSTLAAVIVAACALGASAAIIGDSTPEKILADRGLKRSGALYVLAAEAEFVPKVNKLQPGFRELKARYDELAVIIQNRAEYEMLDDQWTLVNEQLRNVQADQDAHPPTTNNELKQSWRNLLEAERLLRIQYNELRREVNLRYPRLVSESKTEQLRAEFQKQRETFLEGSREPREMADKIKDNYHALSQDVEVKKALDALKLATKSRLGLGPSPDFKKASLWLTNAVRSTAPESLKPAKKKMTQPTKGRRTTPGKDRTKKGATKDSQTNAPASGDAQPAPQ
jgi:Skp family chaperone for outer membrane proteins